MEQNLQPKWEAKVSVSLTKATPDEVWVFYQDFFNLHKYYPGLPISHGIHGVNGEPGCIRYCGGFSVSSKRISSSNNEENPLTWCKERLISIDPTERTLSYEAIDGNIGFNSYVATIKVIPGDKDGCTIEWSFVVDPVEGWRLEDLVKRYEKGLHDMAKSIEDYLEKEHGKPKWEGKATAKLVGVAAEQVWPLLEDFCGISKWLPGVDTSHKIEGVLGQPGLIRYCASTVPPSSGSSGEEKIKWCHERLLEINSIERCLIYEIVNNNLGFKSYISTMKVVPTNSDFDNKDGCQLEWSFISDPVEGWTMEGLLSYVDTSLQAMAKNMKKALVTTEIVK